MAGLTQDAERKRSGCLHQTDSEVSHADKFASRYLFCDNGEKVTREQFEFQSSGESEEYLDFDEDYGELTGSDLGPPKILQVRTTHSCFLKPLWTIVGCGVGLRRLRLLWVCSLEIFVWSQPVVWFESHRHIHLLSSTRTAVLF